MEHRLNSYLHKTFFYKGNGQFEVAVKNVTPLSRFADIHPQFWMDLAKTVHTQTYDIAKDPLESRLNIYIKYIFLRCCEQNLVYVYDKYAIFNTGLCDKHMNEIHVEFVQSSYMYVVPFRSYEGSIRTNVTEPLPKCSFIQTPSELVVNYRFLEDLKRSQYLDLYNIIDVNFNELLEIGITDGKRPKRETYQQLTDLITASFKESIDMCLFDYHMITPSVCYYRHKGRRCEVYSAEIELVMPMRFGMKMAAMVLKLENGEYRGNFLTSLDRISPHVRLLSESLASFNHWSHLKSKLNINAPEFIPSYVPVYINYFEH